MTWLKGVTGAMVGTAVAIVGRYLWRKKAGMAPNSWVIEVESEQAKELTNEDSFIEIVALMRVLNSMRTLQHAAAMAGSHEEVVDGVEPPSERRRRYNTFLLLAATAYEGLKTTRSLGEYFSHLDTYSALSDHINSKRSRKIENDLLMEIRNKMSFHFDKEELVQGIKSLPKDDFILVRGLGRSVAETHYEFADDAALSYLVHLETFEDLEERMVGVIGDVTDYLLEFMKRSDRFIAEAALHWGLSIREVSSTQLGRVTENNGSARAR